VMSRLAPRK